MSDSVQLVLADFEILVWLVIIVGSLIAQMTKSIREKKSAPPPDVEPKQRRRPPILTDAQAELEEFLKSLSRESGQPPPEAPQKSPEEPVATSERPRRPPPLPTSQPQGVPSADPVPHFERGELPVSQIERPFASTPKKTPPHAPLPFGSRDYYQPRPRPSRQQSIKEIRLAIRSDLIDNTALRKAILLQEILTKPLALRTERNGSSRE